MSSDKTNRIFSIIICTILFVLGCLCGSIYEVERFRGDLDAFDELLTEKNTELTIQKSTTDWNALKNVEVNTITTDCKVCSLKVSNAFERLEKRRKQKGVLVLK